MAKHNLKTLSETMSELKAQGFVHEFRIHQGKLMINDSKHKGYLPHEVKILEEFRFEGDTNPDDMSILYALEMQSGEKGLVVNGYGISANHALDAFLLEAENK